MAGSVAILIDAGLTAKALVAGLAGAGLTPSSLAGIVVTHEHGDHAMSAHALSRRWGVPILANRATLACLYEGNVETPHVEIDVGEAWEAGDLRVETFPVPHDAADPVGVAVFHKALGQKVVHITDAGHVTADMRRAVRGAHLLVLEANHDVHRLQRSLYPGALKQRILGDRGHLSNEAAVGLVCEHALAHGPCTVWLAHLSKENNTPKLALGYARATVAVETGCPVVLDVARRDRPSARWSPGARPVQLNLF